MNFLNKLSFFLTMLGICSLPAWTQVTVNYPANGAVVASQFSLSAYDSTCSGQPVSAMGFSLDSSSNNTFAYSTSIYSAVTAPAGAHTLHVKAWGNAGSACDTDVAVTVDGVSVSSPGNGAAISQTFTLVANSVTCSSQPVSAMGYSFDSGGTAFVYANYMNGPVTAPSGAQTLHVKSWGNQGSACDTDVALNMEGSASSGGGVSVNEPADNSAVSSPFALDATSTSCSSQTVSAMGYSLDSSASTAIVYGTSVSAAVTAAAGAHVLHVKSWGPQDAACHTDVNITVSGSGSASGGSNTAPSGGSGPYVPSNAISVTNIQALGDWVTQWDPGTGPYGSSTGAMAMVGSPSITGNALEFYTTYSYYGGDLYYANFGDDTTSSNFVYDGWVYLTNSSGSIANIEMDMNQVMPNGETVIFGFQCDGWNRTWDYTENAGTPTAPVDHWVQSNAACNVQNWSQYAWHHVQVSYARDGYGNVTYQSVWLDGNQQQINATVPSAFALGWAPTLLTNFQVDGVVPGWSSSVVYLDNLAISRW